MGDYFGSLPAVLSPPYSVVSDNQRGCGPSPCDGSFDVDKQVDDLDAIRRHFAADRIHVFGHSYGGLLGQLYAKTYPERMASLVLCCSMANHGEQGCGDGKQKDGVGVRRHADAVSREAGRSRLRISRGDERAHRSRRSLSVGRAARGILENRVGFLQEGCVRRVRVAAVDSAWCASHRHEGGRARRLESLTFTPLEVVEARERVADAGDLTKGAQQV